MNERRGRKRPRRFAAVLDRYYVIYVASVDAYGLPAPELCACGKRSGAVRREIEEIVLHVSDNPRAGDEIVGTGGCRKFRWPGRGKGKRGGLRVITFFSGEAMPVFLITAFGKGERSDLTQRERNALGTMTKMLVSEYLARVRKART